MEILTVKKQEPDWNTLWLDLAKEKVTRQFHLIGYRRRWGRERVDR